MSKNLARTKSNQEKLGRTQERGHREPLMVVPKALALAIVSCYAAPTLALNNPPNGGVSILAFPQRDFVSATGYHIDDRVVVRVIHDPTIYPSATGGTTAEISPDATGLVEVNHPGGACWLNTTPDIRPGDRVQIEVKANATVPARVGIIDETTVVNVKAQRPVQTGPSTIQVHGTATTDNSGAAGPGPLALNLLQSRLVAPGGAFAASGGARTLRATATGAGVEGTLSFDPAPNPNGIHWTATYSGLSAADVTLALGADSRGMWLGNATPPSVESTIFEVGALTFPGPSAPCTAPLEALGAPLGGDVTPPSTPASLSASVSGGNRVTLTWTASTDSPAGSVAASGVVAYGIFRDGLPIFTAQNADGSVNPPAIYTDLNVPPGTYIYQVRAIDDAGNVSGLSSPSGSVTTTPVVVGTPPTVNDPPVLPVNIIAFPSRDFISPSGYQNNDKVTVELFRRDPSGGLRLISSAEGINPVDGFAEVNHPGGACWGGVTPEIRTGDLVRTTAYRPDGSIRTIDQTHIAGVTAFKPVKVQDATPFNNDGIVTISGTALGADGNPIPIGELEQRMVAPRDHFDLSDRRTLRTGLNGTLSYDADNNPMGVKWTAVYENLSADDVARIVGGTSSSTGTVFPGADTRIHWLGRNPGLLNEATIFENSDLNPPGPAGPGCVSGLETPDTQAPSIPGGVLNVALSGNQATLNWGPSSDDWSVVGYRIYDGATPVKNVAPTINTITLNNLTPGSHTFAVRAFDAASPRGAGNNAIAQIAAGFGNLYGNLSDPLSSGSTSSDDVTAPSAPTNLAAVVSGNQVTLTWTASTDNVGIDHYVIHRNLSTSGSPEEFDVDGNITTFADPTILASGNYVYTVEAFDAAGNHTNSAPVSANVTAITDSQAPSIPTNVTAVQTPDVHSPNVTVSWAASTDNVGVTGYVVYRSNNGAPDVEARRVSGTDLTFTEQPGPGTYQYSVAALDSAGNASDKSTQADITLAADVPAAGHSLIAFPARDFISATGYNTAHSYKFALVRSGTTYFTNALPPIASAGTTVVEANHPGASGTCWNVNTPDMRPGDLVQIIDTTTGFAEQTVVSNVTAERPIATNANTVVIHGTAKQADGSQIPIGQLEHRLVSSTAVAFASGRRVLRSGLDGTMAYDTTSPTETKWTATYTGLVPNDVLIAVGGTSSTGTVFPGAVSTALWLGRDPLALLEGTQFENGSLITGGPTAPCTAIGETPVAAASFNPASITANASFTPTVTTSAAQTVTFSNGGGAPMTLTNIYFAGLNPSNFTRLADTAANACPTAFPATLAAGSSCTVKVIFRPGFVGLHQANLSFSDNAANTTDQTVSLTGNGTDTTNPRVTVTWGTAAPTATTPTAAPPVAFGTVNASPAGGRTLYVKVANTGGTALNVATITPAGANAADFDVVSQNCATVNPSSFCTIQARFRPGNRGARTGSLVLAHNATLPSGATSTSIPMTGTGGTGAVLTFPTTQNFSNVRLNTTASATLSLRNAGPQAISGLPTATITGTGATKFTAAVPTACNNLASGRSCNVTVTYRGNATVATFRASLALAVGNGMPAVLNTALTANSR